MKPLTKSMKKFVMTAILSVGLVSSVVTPAFAAIDASSLTNRIGNELQATFSVASVVAEDTVVISWDEGALNLNLESYALTKDVQKLVSYYVSPGEENNDSVTVSVLLKMPQASADALNSLEVGGTSISSSFTDGGYVYYALQEGLEVAVNQAAIAGAFDIAFHQSTTAGSPFSASLIAVKEAAAEEPAGTKTENPTVSSFYSLPFSAEATLTAGATENMKLYFYPVAGAVNGVAVIKLGDGITSFDAAASSFTGYHSGTLTDLTDYWNADTHTLTVPINVPEFPLECYLDLADVTFNSEPGDYTLYVAVDHDGAGTEYSISDDMAKTYTLEEPRN